VGFARETTPGEVRAMVERALRGTPGLRGAQPLRLPWIGVVDPSAVPLPAFTVLIGLVDGINPCAIWCCSSCSASSSS
jgi:hypothetical protein